MGDNLDCDTGSRTWETGTVTLGPTLRRTGTVTPAPSWPARPEGPELRRVRHQASVTLLPELSHLFSPGQNTQNALGPRGFQPCPARGKREADDRY